MDYHFYQIRSQSALPDAEGVTKQSLACEEDPQLHLFFWITAQGQPSHIQFLFGEQVLEWHAGHQPQAFNTNRQGWVAEPMGRFKGVRTLRPEADGQLLAQGKLILSQSRFPPPFGDWVALHLLQHRQT